MKPVSRRHVLFGGVTAAALVSVGVPVARAQPAPPVLQALQGLEQRHQAVIGVHAVDFASGRTIAHRQSDRFAMCSSVKTYVAARILQKFERGELALTDTVVVESADLRSNSPITEARVGQPISLSELCVAALQRSDNAATNYLLEILGGPTAITEFARRIGDTETRLDRWETELNAAVPGDPRDTSTPQAIGDGFRTLLTGDVLGPAARSQLTDWMAANTTSSLRPGLPTGWILADKTGSGDYGSTNDIGVAFGPDGRQVLLSVMVRSQLDNPDAEGFRPTMAEIAALLMPALLN